MNKADELLDWARANNIGITLSRDESGQYRVGVDGMVITSEHEGSRSTSRMQAVGAVIESALVRLSDQVRGHAVVVTEPVERVSEPYISQRYVTLDGTRPSTYDPVALEDFRQNSPLAKLLRSSACLECDVE